MSNKHSPRSNIVVRSIEAIVFNIRWVLPLFYVGLVVVLVAYGYSFFKEIIELLETISTIKMDVVEVLALDMIDIVMVANLIKMIVAGSYNSFVSKAHGFPNENISSGMLKIKIATSVIVVSIMHLLKNFVSKDKIDWITVQQELFIFAAFLLGALVLGILEYLHIKSEVMEHAIQHPESH